MKQSRILIVIVLIVLCSGVVLGASVTRDSETRAPSGPGIACTEEAKLCPDGSGVGREGPNCEFPECPDTSPTLKS